MSWRFAATDCCSIAGCTNWRKFPRPLPSLTKHSQNAPAGRNKFYVLTTIDMSCPYNWSCHVNLKVEEL